MRLSRTVWILLGSATLIAACATITVKKGLLFKSLKFDHAAHLEQGDCGDCHGEIAKSTGPTLGKFIPKKDHGGCASCHEDAVKDKAECKMCHVGSDRSIELTRVNRNLTFSHKAHAEHLLKMWGKKKVEELKGGCKHCHAAAFTAKKAGTRMLGTMAVCTDACHKKDLVDQACDKCHSNLQRQSLGAVAQLGHQGNFLKRHGVLARNTQRCAQCHDQTYCADCHAKTANMPLSIKYPEKVNAQYVHRGNYLARHAADSRAQPATCKKCHGQNHCATCHQLQGLMAPVAGTKNPARTRKVHGGQWMVAGTPGFHGRSARRNAARCASCHDQGQSSNCIRCHKVGAMGGNPHPPSFKWGKKSTECKQNTMCLSCHINGSGCK